MILIEIIHLYKWAPLSHSARVQPLLTTLTEAQADALMEEFGTFILYYFKSRVRAAIKTQQFSRARFDQVFQPLTPKYRAFKKREKLRPGFWEATGYLERYLQTWRTPEGNFAIGFKPHIKHPRWPNHPEVWKIVQTLELGSKEKGIPPRPLFHPIAREISKSIYRDHFKEFIKRKHPEWVDLLV